MEIKNVQIPFDLFRQLVSYHLMDDQSCSEEICKGLMEKVDRMATGNYTHSRKLPLQRKNGKDSGRNIWIDEAYRTVFDGNISC